MLDRMKKDLIALQLTINDLQESLRSKKTIYGDEYKEQMAARQEKLQSKFKLDKLMKNIDHENEKRQERIESLQKSIINKQEALEKRLSRAKRQADIAETAANESKDQNEIEKRANLLIQKAWASFFKKRMEKEMTKYKAIEDSFQKIRTTTGNSDVKEFVQKYMTKEQTYGHLLQAVGQGEKKYDELKLLNEQKRMRLKELQIENDNRKKLEKPDPSNVREYEAFLMQIKAIEESKDGSLNTDAEFARLTTELDELGAEMDCIKERKKKIQLISD